MIVVHTIIPNKTQWLFSNLAYFRAKNGLQSSANGENSLDVMSVFPLACNRSTVIQAISVKVAGIFGIQTISKHLCNLTISVKGPIRFI